MNTQNQTAAQPDAAPTPRTNRAIYNGYDYLIKESRDMERELVKAKDAIWMLRRAIESLGDDVSGIGDGSGWEKARAVLAETKEAQP